MAVTEELDQLLDTLVTAAAYPSALSTTSDDTAGSSGESGAGGTSSAPQSAGRGSGDAIDRELARPKRLTAVVSLRDSIEVETFRNELIDGLIRVDTANQLLRLVNQVMVQLLR